MRFRPCIDLKDGKVVQIVGDTLSDDPSSAQINFETERAPRDFALLYKQDHLTGGHVIALGPGNREAAESALKAFPGGLQYGGGVNIENAAEYLDMGASHVIVTSYLFREGKIDWDNLKNLSERVGRERLVVDISCRRRNDAYWVVSDRWTHFTELEISSENLSRLSRYCDEFLVHGVDVEGKRLGVDDRLVSLLSDACPIPTTYAGGARSLADLDRVDSMGKGRIDLTIGSALDIFGGDLPYEDVVRWRSPKRG